MEERIITQENCRLCDFVHICIVAKVLETLPSCQAITFDSQGCPREW
jgi:hypothetical protein